MFAAAWLLLLVQESAPSRDAVEFFESRIRPVLVERCYSCHSAQASKVKGGLRLDTREGTRKGGDSGPALVPGDPAGSLLMKALRQGDENLRMPPKGKLAPGELDSFETWIRAGAPDPRGRTEPAAPSATHWAFEPVREPRVPSVRNPDWGTNPIDQFILAALEANGLSPSPPADRRTLLRRATFDLTGLPPTPEEVDAFLADGSPGAFERVVDRLLASPHYGERWGRHWLDAARYADTKGYTQIPEDRRFLGAWPYRDWVVRAFNDDLPYDRFLTLQIAADRIAGGDRRDLAALGFLTVGRRFKNVLHDIIDDRIDVLSRATMGLTVSCARCHDHKFDPIPTRDYYSLYGVFAGCTERAVPLVDHLERTPATEAFEKELRKREEAFRKALQNIRQRLEDRHRQRLTDYLLQVLDPDKLPPEEAFLVLQPDELNPVIVRRWQALISRAGKDHPVFGPWNAFASTDIAAVMSDFPWARVHPRVSAAFSGEAPASMQEVARRYGELLANPGDETLRAILFGADSPVRVPARSLAEIEFFLDTESHAELTKLQAMIDRWIVDSDAAPPYAGILEDLPVQTPPRVFRRGNPVQKGEEVPRQFLGFLSKGDPRPFTDGSGRLELARAIVDPENPLTARVMVNRIWRDHFGRGLVGTPSDFGRRSDPPTHPALLDWLARRFVEGGQSWSIKKMHRLILLSSTYRQGHREDPEAVRRDPSNALLWRMDSRRLDWESMRDAFLAVSGELEPAVGGPPEDLTSVPFMRRRTLYGFIDRLNLPNVYPVFDFPSPDSHSPQRPLNTVAPQALFLMNSPFILERARALARRSESEADPVHRIQELYRRAFGRAATAQEIDWGASYVAAQPSIAGSASPAPAWQYGYGEYDESRRRLKDFVPLGHFTAGVWHDGPTRLVLSLSAQVSNLKSGWASLGADGGHPGRDLAHAVVRRWTAPRAGKAQIRGTLKLAGYVGDGIRARIASGRAGEILARTLERGSAEMEIPELELQAGETLDFVVDGRADPNEDLFTWSPTIRLAERSGAAQDWNASRDFAGPSVAPLDGWARYAQVLLASNEFVFVD